ncbi:Chga [Lemmus lemmus]
MFFCPPGRAALAPQGLSSMSVPATACLAVSQVMKCVVEVISDSLSKPSPMPVSPECLEILQGDERVLSILRHQNLLKELQDLALQGPGHMGPSLVPSSQVPRSGPSSSRSSKRSNSNVAASRTSSQKSSRTRAPRPSMETLQQKLRLRKPWRRERTLTRGNRVALGEPRRDPGLRLSQSPGRSPLWWGTVRPLGRTRPPTPSHPPDSPARSTGTRRPWGTVREARVPRSKPKTPSKRRKNTRRLERRLGPKKPPLQHPAPAPKPNTRRSRKMRVCRSLRQWMELERRELLKLCHPRGSWSSLGKRTTGKT